MSRSYGQLRVPPRYRRQSRREEWKARFKTKREIDHEPISLDELYESEVKPEQPQSSQTSE